MSTPPIKHLTARQVTRQAPATQSIAEAILIQVKRAGGAETRRQVQRRLAHRYEADEVNLACDALVASGRLKSTTKQRRGLPSVILAFPSFMRVEEATVRMQMRPVRTVAENHPLIDVTAQALLEVAGAVQKAHILMKMRPEIGFAQALHEALWDHVEEVKAA